MLFPPALESPRLLPGAWALTTNADDRSKAVIKIKLRITMNRTLFPFMMNCCPFWALINRHAAAKILNGSTHAFGVGGVGYQHQVFLQLFDCVGIVFFSPVDAAKIIIGHGELSSICLSCCQQMLF